MQNEEVSDNDAKVRFPPRTIWISFVILLSMLTITIIWFKVANDCDWSKVTLGDIGAILSGTFTALAWYWFIEAYLLQSKELTLQRKTLETQVEELKQSVIAQKGSEKALQNQSKALEEQLEITAKQFKLYLKEYEGKKPLFILNNPDTQFQITYYNYSDVANVVVPKGDHLPKVSTTRLQCKIQLLLKNVGGDCRFKDASLIFYTQIDSNFQLKLSLGGKPYQLKENDRLERLTIFLALEANEIQTYSSTKIYEVAEQALSSVKIKFNYIYADTSSSDIYELKFNEDNNSFTKITDEVL